MTLQNVKRAVEFIDWLGLTMAHSKVETTIMISSIPYILRRPSASAKQPNTICPIMIPALADAFKA